MSNKTNTYIVHYTFTNLRKVTKNFTKTYVNVTKARCDYMIERYCSFSKAKFVKVEIAA